MIQLNEWFNEEVKLSPVRNLFISWLENKGIQGIHDATFEPETLVKEWLSFLFYFSEKISKQGKTMKHLELTAPLQNSIEIGETSKGELYLKSIKLYWGDGTVEGEMAVDKIFVLYDRAKMRINARKG